MKKILFTFYILLAFTVFSIAQKHSFSLRLGGDYWGTHFPPNKELLGKPSVIAGFASTYGYRAGIAYERAINQDWSITPELGYSQGGFDGYNNIFHQKVHQIYFNIMPQYNINKYFKAHLGGLVHYNFRKDSTFLEYVSPVNWAISGGVSFNIEHFELGVRYNHYLNYYYDYRKRYSFATYEREYWRVIGVYIGYHFWHKS